MSARSICAPLGAGGGFGSALTAIAVELTYGQVKNGNVKAVARLPILGPIVGLSSILAVVFAVLAFH